MSDQTEELLLADVEEAIRDVVDPERAGHQRRGPRPGVRAVNLEDGRPARSR